jgi:hypothetical protein
MLTVPQLDPMGALIAELRADPHVSALVGTRVRGFEFLPTVRRPRGAVRAAAPAGADHVR